MDRLPVVNPSNRLLVLWDLIHAIAIVFCVFYIPIELVSLLDFTELYGARWLTVMLVCVLIFVVEIFLQMTTGFYSQGSIVMDKKRIRERYLRQTLLIDLITLSPLILRLSAPYYYLNILMLIKIAPFFRILKKYQLIAIQQKYNILAFVIRLTRLFFNILILGHIQSLIWLAIGQIEQHYGYRNWIDRYDTGTVKEDWLIRYLYSLYWAITTMTTVGYVTEYYP